MDNFLENYTVGMKVGYNILMGKQDLDDIVFYLDEIILPFDPVADIIEIEDLISRNKRIMKSVKF